MNISGLTNRHIVAGILVVLFASTSRVAAQLQIVNPNWNITLTSAGYSDWLYDNTPGYEGREYLSGEWGAAVSYKVGNGTVKSVAPTWLEKNFSFPDWTTNSNFDVVNPITPTAFNPGNEPIAAASTIANADLRIDLKYEMVDTIFGMKMGTSKASAAAGASIDSNRYVLKQTYTLTNTSGKSIQDLNLFQMLHGLNSTTSLYDNRTYAGPQSDYHFDTTQTAIDSTYAGGGGTPTLTGSGSSTSGIVFVDYLNFSSKLAPVAYDNGRYGIDTVDNHGIGKPSVGTHIAIEQDALAGVDYIAPDPAPWVAGAQKYLLGNLADGASVSFDLLLSIRTGTVLRGTGSLSGSANGGSQHPGGVDFWFEDVTEAGDFFAEYSIADHDEQLERIAHGDFSAPNFGIPGDLQIFELEFEGKHGGDINLVFGYNDLILPDGIDEAMFEVYHFVDGEWTPTGAVVDPLGNTLSFTTSSLSPFAIGLVPEPQMFGIAVLAMLGIAARRRVTG